MNFMNTKAINSCSSIVKASVKAFFIIGFTCVTLTAHAKVTQTIGAKEYEKLEEAKNLMDSEQFSAAKRVLDELQSKQGLNNYTRVQIANFAGFYYYSQNQISNALNEYLRVVQDPTGIPDGMFNRTYYTLAQLYFQQEDYRNALSYAQRWFSTIDNPPADAHLLVGQAHFMLNDFRSALPEVQKGIQLYRNEGKRPKENWLVLLRSIYYENGDNQNMLTVVKELLDLYPKTDYLLALASVYSALDDQPRMTAILGALYDGGHLNGKGGQIKNLASLYLGQKAYAKAAMILKDEMKTGVIEKSEKNYLLLAQSYMLSKDFELSLAPLEKVASLSNSAKNYYDLGQSFSFLEKTNEAESAYRKALNLGADTSLKEKIYIALGMTLVDKDKLDEAKNAFNSALGFNSKSKQARQWLNYIKTEQIRLVKMNEEVVIESGPVL